MNFANPGKESWLYALKGSYFIIVHLSADKLARDKAQNALKAMANDALSHL